MRTAKQMLREADSIKKQIDSGKLKGAKLKSAKYRYYNLRYWAKNKQKKVIAQFNKDQGFLPDFLKQLDMVRIEEMVADRLFKDIKDKQIGKQVTKKVQAAVLRLNKRKAA